MTAVLLTNSQLLGATGTEVVVRDLAIGLRGRGDQVAVYSPLLGEPAVRLAAAGVPVIDRLDDCPFVPDVIHGHHHSATRSALDHFPRTPAIWVCHDSTHFDDVPPLSAAIRRYVAVDLNCRLRVAQATGLPAEAIAVVHNAVDLARFPLRAAPAAAAPTRALVFSNQAVRGGYLDDIVEACAARGITVDVIGDGVGATTFEPEAELGRYDVVFAKARCALEALASGCAVVLADRAGIGALVSADNVAELRDWNFGFRCLQSPLTAAAIEQRLGLVDLPRSFELAERLRPAISLDHALDRYAELYAAAIDEGAPSVEPQAALRQLLVHTASLERRVREGSPIDRGPFPPGVAAQVRLALRRRPVVLRSGTLVAFRLTIDNQSAEVLSSSGATPVQMGHHWRSLGPDGEPGAEIEGRRTALPRALLVGDSLDLDVTVELPPTAGRWALELSLVQEHVAWFRDQHPAHAATVIVAVVEGDEHSAGAAALSLAAVVAAAGLSEIEVVRDAPVRSLCFLDDPVDGGLLFIGATAMLQHLPAGISAVLTTAPVAEHVPDHLGVAITIDPQVAFYRLHNALADGTNFYGEATASVIDATARVHPTAWIDPNGVTIGPGCVIGPHASIAGPTELGEGVHVEAGARLGGEAFQIARRPAGLVSMRHVAGIAIGARTRVFPNAIIAGGQVGRPTVIGCEVQIGNGAFVSHRCRIDDQAMIGHGAVVNGGVVIGRGAWIGPGAVIADRLTLGAGCHVALGATVISDVATDAKVMGIPAVGRHQALRFAASLRGRRRG